jgi:16S rRNA (uracil1498-N3)-methyltransferase
MTTGRPDGSGGPHVFVDDLGAAVLSDDDYHHLSRVRRLRDGSPITVCDGRGSWMAAALARAPEATGEVCFVAAPTAPISVGFVAVQGDRTSWAVQKLTEIGVDRIVLLSSSRSVVRWSGERGDKAARKLEAVARSAAEQSRRVHLPVIEPPRPAVELMAAPGVATAQWGGAPPSMTHPTILIGPEGGWDPSELEAAQTTVDLGPGVLRAETAAVVAGTLLQAIRTGLVRGHAE